ncbi:hypothetical protein ACOSP7_014767 [Xanthoceras sorbifolium]
MFSSVLLSRFMHSPSNVHFGIAKRVFRYLKATVEYGIWFKVGEELILKGYADSDWAGCVDDSKSTLGYVFSFGSCAFCWSSMKQEVVAQSTAEAEPIVAASAANQAIWLKKLLDDLGIKQTDPTELIIDNKFAITIATNLVQHGRTKHIKVKFHSIREAEKEGEIKMLYCKSELQLADIFTKSLTSFRFEFLRGLLGVSKRNLKEEC